MTVIRTVIWAHVLVGAVLLFAVILKKPLSQLGIDVGANAAFIISAVGVTVFGFVCYRITRAIGRAYFGPIEVVIKDDQRS